MLKDMPKEPLSVGNVEKISRSTELDAFNEALRRIMRVSKSDLNEIVAKEKAANADKPKRGPKAGNKLTRTP